MDVSIIIPVYNGGYLLQKTLSTIFSQETNFTYEVIIIDSGSDKETNDILEDFEIKLFTINKIDFNHGLTRDLGAEKSKGDFLIFINQDAEPCDRKWLNHMVQPLIDDNKVLATQGGIIERKDMPLFFWHSCGERFYFTSESNDWIKKYHNMGFSTVNCCIRKSSWENNRFGKMDILEDKKFQSKIHINGFEIVYSEGCVFHTHNYNVEQLSKRCQNEGYGWNLVGVKYSLNQTISDIFTLKNYKELFRGFINKEIKQFSEVLFPFMRPIWLYTGNNINRRLL